MLIRGHKLYIFLFYNVIRGAQKISYMDISIKEKHFVGVAYIEACSIIQKIR